VHVCQAGSADESRHLAVRDFLREHPVERQRHETLKRGLMLRAPEDRLVYIECKRQYVDALEVRALGWAR
jgi:GrpB-like predicted nucleotidyltransferase (UPF0157 family)